jgi:hypothetical protein
MPKYLAAAVALAALGLTGVVPAMAQRTIEGPQSAPAYMYDPGVPTFGAIPPTDVFVGQGDFARQIPYTGTQANDQWHGLGY